MIEHIGHATHPHIMVMTVRNRGPEIMSPEAIGRRLTLIREAHGLKKAEIADLLGIERTYWSRFELGKRPIPYDLAYRLVERFNVTLDFVILGRIETLPVHLAERIREIDAS